MSAKNLKYFFKILLVFFRIAQFITTGAKRCCRGLHQKRDFFC